MPVDPASRLAFEVKRRRAQLARTQLEVHAAGGPSNTTQTNIENATIETLALSTAKKLDRGLAWEPGSAMRVWRGEGSPTPIPPATGTAAGHTDHVGASTQDDGYVASPGDRVEGGSTDSEVLREIRAMRDEQRRMSERLARVEERLES